MDTITVLQIIIGVVIGIGVICVKRNQNMGSKTACVFYMALFLGFYECWFVALGALCVTFVVFQALCHALSGTTSQRA